MNVQVRRQISDEQDARTMEFGRVPTCRRSSGERGKGRPRGRATTDGKMKGTVPLVPEKRVCTGFATALAV